MADEPNKPDGKGDNKKPPAVPPAVRDADPGIRLSIEIGGRMNQSVLFGPTAARLRGRWDGYNLNGGDASEAGLRKMPTIPGMMVSLDSGTRTAKVTDPLSFPENQQLLSEVANVRRSVFRKEVRPVDPVVRTGMSADEMATWLYWMMRAAHDGNAFVREGRLPGSEEEVLEAFPGAKIKKTFFDTITKEIAKEPAAV